MMTIVKEVVSLIKDIVSIFSGLFSKPKSKEQESSKLRARPEVPLPFSDVKSKIFSVDNDIESLKNCIRDDVENKSKAEVYFSNYDVSIQLIMTEEGVKIKSSYTISFINPYGVSYRFRRKPMVREGLQYESYHFTDVSFQNKNRDDLIRMYDSSEQAPHPRYRFKTGIELYYKRTLRKVFCITQQNTKLNPPSFLIPFSSITSANIYQLMLLWQAKALKNMSCNGMCFCTQIPVTIVLHEMWHVMNRNMSISLWGIGFFLEMDM